MSIKFITKQKNGNWGVATSKTGKPTLSAKTQKEAIAKASAQKNTTEIQVKKGTTWTKAPITKTVTKKVVTTTTTTTKETVVKTGSTAKAKKAPAKKKPVAKKAPAKKVVAKKKPVAKKAPAKKVVAKKKPVAKKAAAKKVVAKKKPVAKKKTTKSKKSDTVYYITIQTNKAGKIVAWNLKPAKAKAIFTAKTEAEVVNKFKSMALKNTYAMVQDKDAHFSYKLVPSTNAKGVMTYKKVYVGAAAKPAAKKAPAKAVSNKTVVNKTIVNKKTVIINKAKEEPKKEVKKVVVVKAEEAETSNMPGWLGFLLAILILGAVIGLAFILGTFL